MPTSPESHLRTQLLASAAVSALIGTRLEPEASSEATILPRIIYSRQSSDRSGYMGGGSGLLFLRIQFDIFAKLKTDLENVADAVRNRIDGFRGTITTGSDTLRFFLVRLEEELDQAVTPTDGSDQIVFHRVLDFFVSCQETVPTLT